MRHEAWGMGYGVWGIWGMGYGVWGGSVAATSLWRRPLVLLLTAYARVLLLRKHTVLSSSGEHTLLCRPAYALVASSIRALLLTNPMK